MSRPNPLAPAPRGVDDDAFEERLRSWLQESAGVNDWRRVVRVGPSSILVSKFEEGFAARLMDNVDRLSEIFDTERVAMSCSLVAADQPAITRVDAWRLALTAVLRGACKARGIAPEQRAEVQAGIDSVAALVDSILWTGPAARDPYTPGPGEAAAHAEALERMNAENGMFTRSYGTFEGLPVMNHCPGAAIARRLFAQAWAICTAPAPMTGDRSLRRAQPSRSQQSHDR